MGRHTGLGVGASALLSLIASPAPAQYKADIVVTGGPHAGTYALSRAPLTTCTLGNDAADAFQIAMDDTTARGHKGRVASLTVVFVSVEQAAIGTNAFHLAIGFGGDALAEPPAIRYNGLKTAHPPGADTLTFDFAYREETFQASFSAATTDGTDSVRVSATFACKGVTRGH